MVRSRNLSRRQKTHSRRVYPENKAVQLPNNQGEPSRYPAQTRSQSRGKSNRFNGRGIIQREYAPGLKESRTE
jgi:hypothetical protein